MPSASCYSHLPKIQPDTLVSFEILGTPPNLKCSSVGLKKSLMRLKYELSGLVEMKMNELVN